MRCDWYIQFDHICILCARALDLFNVRYIYEINSTLHLVFSLIEWAELWLYSCWTHFTLHPGLYVTHWAFATIDGLIITDEESISISWSHSLCVLFAECPKLSSCRKRKAPKKKKKKTKCVRTQIWYRAIEWKEIDIVALDLQQYTLWNIYIKTHILTRTPYIP